MARKLEIGSFLGVLAAVVAWSQCSWAQAPARPVRTIDPLSKAGVQFTRYVDPAERGFTVDVPAGWRISGATQRVSAIDVTMMVVAVSPDNAIEVAIGLPPVSLRSIPPISQWEGKWSTEIPGALTTFPQFFQSYMPGTHFLSHFLRYEQTDCRRPVVTYAFDDQELGAAASARLTQMFQNMVNIRMDLGTVDVSCAGGYVGNLAAATLLAAMPGAATWTVQSFSAFISLPDRLPVAIAVAERMAKTMQQTPEWLEMQARVTQASAAIAKEVSDYSAAISRQIYARRSQVYDRAMRDFSDMQRGVTTVRDPYTGEAQRVESGYRYYWRDNRTGGFVGSDTDQNMGPNFTRWQTISP